MKLQFFKKNACSSRSVAVSLSSFKSFDLYLSRVCYFSFSVVVFFAVYFLFTIYRARASALSPLYLSYLARALLVSSVPGLFSLCLSFLHTSAPLARARSRALSIFSLVYRTQNHSSDLCLVPRPQVLETKLRPSPAFRPEIGHKFRCQSSRSFPCTPVLSRPTGACFPPLLTRASPQARCLIGRFLCVCCCCSGRNNDGNVGVWELLYFARTVLPVLLWPQAQRGSGGSDADDGSDSAAVEAAANAWAAQP